MTSNAKSKRPEEIPSGLEIVIVTRERAAYIVEGMVQLLPDEDVLERINSNPKKFGSKEK